MQQKLAEFESSSTLSQDQLQMLIEDFWSFMTRLEQKALKNEKKNPKQLKLLLAQTYQHMSNLKSANESLEQDNIAMRQLNKELMKDGDELSQKARKQKQCILDILRTQGYQFQKLFQFYEKQQFHEIKKYFEEQIIQRN